MASDELRRRAAYYRNLARCCHKAVARLMLDQCAQSYEAEAAQEAARELRRRQISLALGRSQTAC